MRPPSSPSEGEEGRAPHFVQSLERGLAVIRAFDEHNPELTLSDVARATGLTRAAARRFLLTLAELGYVRTDGRWAIRTVKPGEAGGQAPHIAVSVFARGLLHRVVTRIYFADEADANAGDRVLSGLDEPARATLVAAREEDGYRFDVRLQGPDETAFFAV